jgi:hypothetical protein
VPLTLLALAGLAGLVVTNPDPQAFEGFAADRLTLLLSEELCGSQGLPMLARLVIRDCPALVASQRGVLGRLALLHSRRHNLGLLSLYRTEMGGQPLLGLLPLPRYSALTLGAAGRFLILHSEQADAGEIRR